MGPSPPGGFRRGHLDDQPSPQPVLVLVLQQLDVLQEQQLEQEQLELVAPSTRSSTASTSSISNVSLSSARSSSVSRVMCFPPLKPLEGDRSSPTAISCSWCSYWRCSC